MLGATTSFELIRRDLPAALDRTAKQPTVERATERYLEAISSIKTVEDFLSNDRVYNYAMKAFGLEDMTYAKAFMRKVLVEGIDDKESFANKLTDNRYKDFAETFNFARYDKTAMAFDRAQQGVVDKYVRQTLEEDTGTQSEGARLALYFERAAPSITTTYSILADSALMKVVQVAFGLPPEMGALDIDKQAEIYGNRLDIEDLKDPEKLQKLLTRFTAIYDTTETSAQATNPALALFGSPSAGIDGNLLLTLQSYRSGGF
ncbi:MAG TPA: DUF1217 domain-containing protein [Aurantimonas coralicida]|uniref:DUF1217 domain-containing protein n=2 Tax=root TaxID=1 RepID=A0A9C9NCN1_9HYPH|nr:DUF1217 domain-containing protein [Aurantimonas coralicida]HET99065.1 DUF1217 domain-containing protein [Aurantimonas coralicida]